MSTNTWLFDDNIWIGFASGYTKVIHGGTITMATGRQGNN